MTTNWRKRQWPNFRALYQHSHEGTDKKDSTRISSLQCRDLNPGPPVYNAAVLTTPPRRSERIWFRTYSTNENFFQAPFLALIVSSMFRHHICSLQVITQKITRPQNTEDINRRLQHSDNIKSHRILCYWFDTTPSYITFVTLGCSFLQSNDGTTTNKMQTAVSIKILTYRPIWVSQMNA